MDTFGLLQKRPPTENSQSGLNVARYASDCKPGYPQARHPKASQHVAGLAADVIIRVCGSPVARVRLSTARAAESHATAPLRRWS